jgi:hypothetical protein
MVISLASFSVFKESSLKWEGKEEGKRQNKEKTKHQNGKRWRGK